jgi:hypothetical protein
MLTMPKIKLALEMRIRLHSIANSNAMFSPLVNLPSPFIIAFLHSIDVFLLPASWGEGCQFVAPIDRNLEGDKRERKPQRRGSQKGDNYVR